jgi:hypothetical protein
VANSGYSHNNDRPTVILANGKSILIGRYTADQPGFAEWDARLQKDFALGQRYKVQLSGDFYNLTNRANLYSNPDTSATINYPAGQCNSWANEFPGSGALGLDCAPFTVAGMKAAQAASGYRSINQVAPGSTPFAFQAGVKFMF